VSGGPAIAVTDIRLVSIEATDKRRITQVAHIDGQRAVKVVNKENSKQGREEASKKCRKSPSGGH
jgi:hypothetical protein